MDNPTTIKVFLFVFNRPDILRNQVRCLRKWVKNPIEIIIIQNRHHHTYDEEFFSISNELGIQLYQNTSLGNLVPSQYHANSLQFAYNNFIDDGDIVLFLDHDMFAIDEIDLIDYLDGYDVAGLYQQKGHVKYIWPGIMLFRYSSVKQIDLNFSPQICDNQILDSGGGTYKLFQNKLKIKDTGIDYPDSYEEHSLDGLTYPFELHMDQKFLHMRNASQWDNKFIIIDNDKTNILEMILENFL